MARLFDDASSQHLNVPVADLDTAPLSISAWAYPDDATINLTIYWVGDKDALTGWQTLFLAGAITGDPLRMQTRAGVNSNAETSNGYVLNSWNHCFGAVSSGGLSRTSILNGDVGNKGTTVDSHNPTGYNRTQIGRRGDATPSGYMSGRIAEVAVWDVELTDDEAVSLSKGISPLLIRPESLVSYRPLYGRGNTEIELISGNNQIARNGPTAAEHPPIYGIRSPFIGVPSAAVAAAAINLVMAPYTPA